MNLDQDLAVIRDSIPRLWWAYYRGCIEAGFTEPQAFALLQTQILAQNPYGIHPNDTPQKLEDQTG